MNKYVKFENGKYVLYSEMVGAIRLVFPNVKYVAMDMNGDVCTYDRKPDLGKTTFSAPGIINGVRVLRNYAGDNWKNSLIKLPVEIPGWVLKYIHDEYPTAKKIAKTNYGYMAICIENNAMIFDNGKLVKTYSWIVDTRKDLSEWVENLDDDVIELE